MTRMIFIGFAIFAFLQPRPSRADEAPGNTETPIGLTISPAAAPVPALRYMLLPELSEMNPGNPVQGYLRCFMEQQRFFFDKQFVERRDKLLTMPLKDLPDADLKDYQGGPLTQVDLAARLDTPDWQILLGIKRDGVNLLLPDLQSVRGLATALKVRFRGEVAHKKFDAALHTAQTMFALSRHLSIHPTLIGDLVGIAVANTAIGPIEELIEQPGSPNLYWALTALPRPLVSLDAGLQGERVMMSVELRDLDDAHPMSPDQLERLLAHVDQIVRVEGMLKSESGFRPWLAERCKDKDSIQAARGRLTEYGLKQDQLEKFPPEQILMLDEKREFEIRRDDLMKLMNLSETQIALLGGGEYRSGPRRALFADAFMPAYIHVRQTQSRLEQRLALLRCVEALRLHAAAHDGKLPAKLGDLAVPLPDDPFTSKAFQYELTGGVAHLRGSPAKGKEKDPAYNVHYLLSMRK